MRTSFRRRQIGMLLVNGLALLALLAFFRSVATGPRMPMVLFVLGGILLLMAVRIVGAVVWQCPRCGAPFGRQLVVSECPECHFKFE